MNDDKLKTAVQRLYRSEDSSSPDFDEIWAQAEIKAKAHELGKNRGLFTTSNAGYAASLAAAIAVVLIGAGILTNLREGSVPNMAAESMWIDSIDDSLMSATTWSAPSDALLPKPSIDIYSGLPTLFESTEPEVETLL